MRRSSLASGAAATLIAALIAAALGGCGQWVRYDGAAGPDPTETDLSQVARLRHTALADLMSSYVTRDGTSDFVVVDYVAWADDAESMHLLESYRRLLAGVDPAGLDSDAQRWAYWVNGYNASVMWGVLTRFEGRYDFRVIDGSFFRDRVYTFAGVAMSLDHIEHGVLRGDWTHDGVAALGGSELDRLVDWHHGVWGGADPDPRLHAALNCAARSCPNLLDAPPWIWDPDQREIQLDAATTAWLDSPAKGAGPVGISTLFDWFRTDFERTHGSIDAFITAYRTEGASGIDTTRYLPYDWTLNIR